MYTRTKDQIIEIISKNGPTQVKDLVQILGITQASVHRALNKLMVAEVLQRKGTPPKVFYFISHGRASLPSLILTDDEISLVKKNYLYIDPTGQIKKGIEGFVAWMTATKNRQKIENCIRDYLVVLNEAHSHRNKKDLIDATERHNQIFERQHLDKVFYFEFYSLIKFGKTRMGQYLLHGKQAQDKKIIQAISEEVKESIFKIITEQRIDAIAWAPHSIPRKVPFLKELEKNLKIDLPRIEIKKVYQGEVPVAQKSLSKIEERIQNAQETMVVVPMKLSYKKVLLIDDAVGSGATLNEIAFKLKNKGVKSVIGFAIVGSYKGFEVIKEV